MLHRATRLMSQQWPALALLGLAAIVRLIGLDSEFLWYDEQHSANAILASPGEVIQRVSQDAHPPLFYFLLHCYERLLPTATIFTLRLFPLAWGVAGLALVYAFGRRFLSQRAALWALAMGAVLNFHVVYSQELRAYTMVMALTLASNYFLARGIATSTNRRWHLAFSAGASILGLLTHYHVLFFIAAQGMLLLGWSGWKRQWNLLGDWIFFLALGFLIYGLWLPHHIRQFFNAYIHWLPEVPWWTGALYPVGVVLMWEINHLFTSNALAAIVVFTVFLGIIWLLGRRAASLPRHTGTQTMALWLLAATMLGPIVIVTLFSIVVQNLLFPRYLFFITSGVLLIAGHALTRMRTGWALTAFAAIAGLNLILIAHAYQTRSKPDWRVAFDYAVRQAGEDGVFLFHAEPLHHAFARHTKLNVPPLMIEDSLPALEELSHSRPAPDMAIILYDPQLMADEFPRSLLRKLATDWERSVDMGVMVMLGRDVNLGGYFEHQRELKAQLNDEFDAWRLVDDPSFDLSFHAVEADTSHNIFRWSKAGQGRIVLPISLPPGPYRAEWEINAWRPANTPAFRLEIKANGQSWPTPDAVNGPMSVSGPVRIAEGDTHVTFDFTVTTWQPAVYVKDSADDRELGFMIYSIGLKGDEAIGEDNHE